jgi:hypothetical protein
MRDFASWQAGVLALGTGAAGSQGESRGGAIHKQRLYRPLLALEWGGG